MLSLVRTNRNDFRSMSITVCRMCLIFQQQIKGLREELRYTRVNEITRQFHHWSWQKQHKILANSKLNTPHKFRMQSVKIFSAFLHWPAVQASSLSAQFAREREERRRWGESKSKMAATTILRTGTRFRQDYGLLVLPTQNTPALISVVSYGCVYLQ